MTDRMISSIWSWLKTRHVTVPQDWVAACLEWISSENENAKDEVVVRKMVYEQWLLTDLRDFGEPCLPSGVKDESFTLKGIFCVQCDNVTDVSQPKYSQLLQRQNKESGNTFICAETQPTQKPWEAKPTRMLMMKITDGVTELAAMEYMTIAALSDKLPPGSKIRIKGPIKCRRGVLMLKQSNVEVLGGEVEDLFAANNYDAVLCQGLGRPPPSHSFPADNQRNEVLPSVRNPEIPDSGIANEDLHNILADAEFDDDFNVDDLPNLEKISGTGTSSSKQENRDVIAISDDETLADILEDADNEDDELIASADLPLLNKSSKIVKSGCAEKQNERIIADFPTRDEQKVSSLGNRNVKVESYFQGNDANSRYPHAQVMTDKSALMSNPVLKSSGRPGSKSHESSSLANAEKFSSQRPGTSGGILAMKTEPNSSRVTEGQTSMTHSSDAASSCPKRPCLELTNRPSYQRSNPIFSEKDVRSYLCHAKRSLLSNLVVKKLNIRIKAIVITLLSKLNSDIILGWSLKARICDGTSMLDVEFGNSVLQKLIGFSVADRDAIKQTQNSSEKQKLMCGLSKCRQTIISICHFMGVEVRKLDNNQLMGFVTDLEL